MSVAFHYPPDLFELLVQTIPLLCRSKQNVLTFLKGAGVDPRLMSSVTRKVNEDKDSITKYEIVRTVIERLNEKGDATLAARREVLRRIVEFEDFSTCWPDDRLKAQGLVAQIRQVVNIKDSFTRMREEFEREQRDRRADKEAKRRQDLLRRETLVNGSVQSARVKELLAGIDRRTPCPMAERFKISMVNRHNEDLGE